MMVTEVVTMTRTHGGWGPEEQHPEKVIVVQQGKTCYSALAGCGQRMGFVILMFLGFMWWIFH